MNEIALPLNANNELIYRVIRSHFVIELIIIVLKILITSTRWDSFQAYIYLITQAVMVGAIAYAVLIKMRRKEKGLTNEVSCLIGRRPFIEIQAAEGITILDHYKCREFIFESDCLFLILEIFSRIRCQTVDSIVIEFYWDFFVISLSYIFKQFGCLLN